MTFRHIETNVPRLDRYDINGLRHYNTPAGLLPSITTVLGYGDNSWVDEWKARVGEDQANKIMRQACNRGTQLHKFCEDYLQNKPVNLKMPMDFALFGSIRKHLNLIDDVHLQETPLYSAILGIAGTVDCIAKYDGVLSVIDFKTAAEVKDKSWIDSYFIQTTAYCHMAKESAGLDIDQIVIIMATESGIGHVYIETKDKWLEPLSKKIQVFRDSVKY